MKIGIDLGGSHISIAILNSEGKILAQKEKDIQKIDDKIQCYLKDNIVSLIKEIVNETAIPLSIIEEIGIAVPGKVQDNKIVYCHNLGLKNFDLVNELKELYDGKIKLSNDGKCAAVAEKKFGNLRDSNNCIFLCLGTGIGGAAFIDGKLFRDNNVEIGHMIIKKDGNLCKCGNRGCFETYCSMKTFKKNVIDILELNKYIDSRSLLDVVKEELKRGNNKQLELYINEYIDDLILGISNICNIFNPEVICFGGSFVYFEEILFKRLKENICIEKYKFNVPQLRLALLENNAGIIGAVEEV